MAERRTVLIVEDHEDTRELLRIALEGEGFGVITATNGVKLVPLVRSHMPSLILLDMMLPWVDGIGLCQALKDDPELHAIPIFFISANTTAKVVEQAIGAGAVEYLGKPIDIGGLLERMRRHLPPVS